MSRAMLRQSRFRSSLYSLLSRPFVCEYHTISTVPRFQPPPRRTQRADFLALRSPVCARQSSTLAMSWSMFRPD